MSLNQSKEEVFMQLDEDTKSQSNGGKGTVFITENRCKGCSFCVSFCPTHALVMTKRLNHKGYPLPALGKPELCNGCDMCGLYCPDFAIFGVRFKDLAEGEKRS
jgi:2-oxoglutarate ferredoxin oxidoreductase subunit delta